MADDAPTYRPGDLARPEQQTSFSTPMFSVPDIQLDAGHEAAKQAFAQRQAQQPELAELHRQALETARNEPQERGWQEGAMREQPGRDDTTLYPESAVRSGIETAARSGLARGYEMGRQHAAAGTPAPARVVGRVFAGRDVSENMTGLATGTAE
jgi:flagellar biosynthesis/type III secretory pathway protein FliH